MTRCSGITKNKTPCKNRVSAGTIHCRHHSGECVQKEKVTGKVKEKVKRVNCESNAYELIFVIILAGFSGLIPLVKNIEDMTEVVEHLATADYPNVTINKKENYIKSFFKINRDIGQKYINKLLEVLSSHIFVRVFLCGKSELPEIKDLNKGIKLKDRKADVYGCTKDGKWTGFSVKQNTKCTKSNWSVEKIIDMSGILRILRREFLVSKGYTKFEKKERDSTNALFYEDNQYFTELRKSIVENKNKIIAEFSNKLYGSKLPYPLYEFDGKSIINMSDISAGSVTFDEHDPYYYTKTGDRRCAAKMFYRLQINLTVYRVEIRWKGNVFHSPQFQTHLE